MTTNTRALSMHTLAAFIALLACDNGDEQASAEDAAVAACAAGGASELACVSVAVGPAFRCAFVWTVSVTDEATCETTPKHQCLAYPENDDDSDCLSIAGCHDSYPGDGTFLAPSYRQMGDGPLEIVEQCGQPVGFTPCTSGAVGADIPACSCACEGAP